MTTLDRGFKAWAERTAMSLRRDIGLDNLAPLDASKLAAYLEIELLTPHDLAGLPPEVLHQLLTLDPWGWSAVTFELQGRTTVIYNPKKSPGRQASDIMHEVAHVILGHDPATVIFSHDGGMAMRTFNQKQEDEANCLAWAVLLPREALLAARKLRTAKAQIASAYGVTERLVDFRLQTTGVNAQLRRRTRPIGA